MEEIGESVAAVGYQQIDPIIVVANDDETATVLEGNRRVGALKLLANPLLAPERKIRYWEQLRGSMDQRALNTINEIPVRVAESRDDELVASYIGFRHVSGVEEWRPEQKACYIVHLVDELGLSFRAVGKWFGHYSSTISKNYYAYKLLLQAQNYDLPGADQIKFGVLMRALQVPGIVNHIELGFPAEPEEGDPISKEKIDELRELLVWLFGTDEVDPVLKDSRQLVKFGQILETDRAVRHLRTSPNPKFQVAWRLAGGEVDELVDSLYVAAENLREAVAVISEHQNNENVHAAVSECARFLREVIRPFPGIHQQYLA